LYKIEELRDHDYLTQKSDKEKELEEVIEGMSSEQRKLEEKVRKQAELLARYRKKLKLEKQRTKRLKSKVATLSELIISLKQKKLISGHHEEILSKKFSNVSQELINRMKKVKKGQGRKYSPLLKSFALTLQFYSTKAYNFVRNTFDKALPHQRYIRQWYSKIPAEPGFTEPSFR